MLFMYSSIVIIVIVTVNFFGIDYEVLIFVFLRKYDFCRPALLIEPMRLNEVK